MARLHCSLNKPHTRYNPFKIRSDDLANVILETSALESLNGVQIISSTLFMKPKIVSKLNSLALGCLSNNGGELSA